MAIIAVADFLTIADEWAAGRVQADTKIGDGTTSNSLSKAAVNIRDDVLGLDDEDQELDLLQPSVNLRTALTTTELIDKLNEVRTWLTDLRAHVGGNISTFLTGESEEVHWAFALTYYNAFTERLSAAAVFSPIVDMGDWLSSGAGAGTFTDGSAIDTVLYATAQLEAYIPTGVTIGAGSLVLTVTCVKADNTTEDKDVTITDGAGAGTTFDIGSASDVYKDISAVSAAGGVASDAVEFRNKQPRTVAVS